MDVAFMGVQLEAQVCGVRSTAVIQQSIPVGNCFIIYFYIF